MADWEIRQLETPESLEAIEALQDVIWPGNQVEIVPVHVFLLPYIMEVWCWGVCKQQAGWDAIG